MSEYQYYEFRAIDRPLTSQEMSDLRALSSRARITPSSVVNTYNYGDFRGDPDALMEKLFDAFVYVANWGTRRFVLRIPKMVLGRRECASYCQGESLRVWTAREHIILSFESEGASRRGTQACRNCDRPACRHNPCFVATIFLYMNQNP
jgi:hypothetical protein